MIVSAVFFAMVMMFLVHMAVGSPRVTLRKRRQDRPSPSRRWSNGARAARTRRQHPSPK